MPRRRWCTWSTPRTCVWSAGWGRAERFRACELAVTQALAQNNSVQDSGPQVLQAVAATLGWPHAELWLVDQEAALLRPAACYDDPGRTGTVRVPGELHHGQGLAGRAWRSGEPVWVRDIRTDAAVSADATDGAALGTALAVPVPSGGRTLAVMALFADAVEDPEDLLVALLQGVAAQVGQFLERRRAEGLQLALTRTTDEYLALIGHEMRTPLTSIASYADLMRGLDDTELGADARRLLDVVERSSDELRHIIDELLDLAAIETGHASLACQPVDLAATAREAVAAAGELAPAGVGVVCEAPESCPVRADPHRLRQVLDALLSNAVPHTPGGGVVRVRVAPAGAQVVEVTVADTGIGIPDAERDQVFTRFYRCAPTRDRRIPGAGLGLAVSRAIVELHRGSIRLVPRPGPGTCVQIRLPVECC